MWNVIYNVSKNKKVYFIGKQLKDFDAQFDFQLRLNDPRSIQKQRSVMF